MKVNFNFRFNIILQLWYIVMLEQYTYHIYQCLDMLFLLTIKN